MSLTGEVFHPFWLNVTNSAGYDSSDGLEAEEKISFVSVADYIYSLNKLK